MTAFVPLREAGIACGAKAAMLGRLLRAGFAVPDGFALPVGSGAGWERELTGVLATLGGSRFAVRSSAPGEDGSEASFAGQFRTALNVSSDEVEAQVRRTAAAVDEARTYAGAVGRPVPRGIAVIVQRMLVPDAAGVAFTRDPISGRRAVVLEAVRGLGDRLVSGQVSPERWRIAPGGGPRPAATPEVLSAEQAVTVSRVAMRAEEVLGGGRDLEWALTGTQVWVLQARPITSAPRSDRSPACLPDMNAMTVASGTPASPGRARGVVRIVNGLDDFTRFAPGEVLVCRATSPAWTPLLARAAAVVTTRGGVLAHAAIVARELRIPAVTDVTSAMDLPEDMLVDVDGSTGTITTQKAR